MRLITLAGLLPGLAAVPAIAQQPAPASPAQPTFRGADGKPLPPEVEARLREQFKDALPPAQAPSPTPGSPASAPASGDIVVRALRPRGSVLGDIPPERTLSPADIRAFGADTLDELITALGAQVRSNRGRGDDAPIVLLNGKRVAGYAEIARLPPEAIERMEVLPEEVALRYGYRADQKVVNVVAFERYSAKVGVAGLNGPTGGGRPGVAVTGNLLVLRDDTRFNLDLEHSRAGKLLESERDIRQVGGDPGLGRSRTLVPATDRSVVNATVAGTILTDVSATLNGRFEAAGSAALLGRGPAGALARDVNTATSHLGTTLGGRLDGWQWSFTGTFDRIVTETLTDRAAGGPRDRARAVNALAGADLLLAGPVLALPAGPVSASIRSGVDLRDFTARSRVAGIDRDADLGRDRAVVQANLDLPLTRSETPVIGQLTLSGNAGVERLSDAGTLLSHGYGISWTPVAAVNLLASVAEEEGAPSVEQLGAPLVVTPSFRTFDFARGQTVDVTRVSGGNPALRPDHRRVTSLGVSAQPIRPTDLTVTLDYIDTRIDDPNAPAPSQPHSSRRHFPSGSPAMREGGSSASTPPRSRSPGPGSGRCDGGSPSPARSESSRQRCRAQWSDTFRAPPRRSAGCRRARGW